jgi:hypothetical protein
MNEIESIENPVNPDVEVKCYECGCTFTIKYTTYMSRPRNHQRRCFKCRTAAGRKSWLKNWEEKPQEEKEHISEQRREWYQRAPKERVDEVKQRRREGIQEYFKNLSEEERAKKIATGSQNLKKAIEYCTSKEGREKQAELAKTKYMSMTPEERNEKMMKIRDGWNKWFSNADNRQKFSELMKSQWANLTKEEYYRYMLKQQLGVAASNNPNQVEAELIDKLNILIWNDEISGYKFQYVNQKIHEDFETMFPVNPVSGSDKISPYHVWDFIIYKTDGTSALVDVDGSIHFQAIMWKLVVDGKDIGESIKFKDSQRPYQTDGMDAYVVLAYSNTVTDDTPVLSLQSGEIMTVRQMLVLLTPCTYGKKKKKK